MKQEQIKLIKAKLENAEKSGLTYESKEEIFVQARALSSE